MVKKQIMGGKGEVVLLHEGEVCRQCLERHAISYAVDFESYNTGLIVKESRVWFPCCVGSHVLKDADLVGELELTGLTDRGHPDCAYRLELLVSGGT